MVTGCMLSLVCNNSILDIYCFVTAKNQSKYRGFFFFTATLQKKTSLLFLIRGVQFSCGDQGNKIN